MMCSSMSSLAPTPSVCLRSLSHLSQTCGSRRLRHERQQVRLRSRQEWARRRGVGKSMNEGTHHGNGKCAIKMHVYAAAQERRESVDRATVGALGLGRARAPLLRARARAPPRPGGLGGSVRRAASARARARACMLRAVAAGRPSRGRRRRTAAAGAAAQYAARFFRVLARPR